MGLSLTDWKAERQYKTNVDFCELLSEKVKQHYNTTAPDVVQIIAYLIQHNVIRQSMINRFMVVNLYPEALRSEGKKERAIWAISNRVPLEPSGVYSILANHYNYFRPNRFRYP